MEGPLKELAKLEKLTTSASRGKSPSIGDSLDSLQQSLQQAKQDADSGALSSDVVSVLASTVDSTKKEIDERQKEIYSSLSRYGKTLDKKFTSTLPAYPPLFQSESSSEALDKTIALHFLRTGQFGIAETFLEETKADIPDDLRSHFVGLHRILTALKGLDNQPALEWARNNRQFLKSRSSPLEFHLCRSQYMRLLLSHPTNPNPALAYAKSTLNIFWADYAPEIKRLTACVMYLPTSRLHASPYADLLSPTLHSELEPLFAKEFCASLGMSRQLPLKIVGDIGGGGALARIEKGRKVMRERKSGWSQTGELPIEIPLPPENRYHSIFACPVSKEQSTDQNPPMMMTCGHVIAKDSLQKLGKQGGRVKCPYCPMESSISSALRVYF